VHSLQLPEAAMPGAGEDFGRVNASGFDGRVAVVSPGLILGMSPGE
jgi:hypothetical protein